MKPGTISQPATLVQKYMSVAIREITFIGYKMLFLAIIGIIGAGRDDLIKLPHSSNPQNPTCIIAFRSVYYPNFSNKVSVRRVGSGSFALCAGL
jgi:hypothetical protein